MQGPARVNATTSNDLTGGARAGQGREESSKATSRPAQERAFCSGGRARGDRGAAPAKHVSKEVGRDSHDEREKLSETAPRQSINAARAASLSLYKHPSDLPMATVVCCGCHSERLARRDASTTAS